MGVDIGKTAGSPPSLDQASAGTGSETQGPQAGAAAPPDLVVRTAQERAPPSIAPRASLDLTLAGSSRGAPTLREVLPSWPAEVTLKGAAVYVGVGAGRRPELADVVDVAVNTLGAPTAQALFVGAPEVVGATLASGPVALLQRISGALNAGAAQADPELDGAAALAERPGGLRHLASSWGEPSSGSDSHEPLRVGLMAWQLHQQLARAEVPMEDPRWQIVLSAAAHAAHVAQPSAASSAVSPPGDSALAYQLVRNGLVEQGPGSARQRANQWLDKIANEWLQHTARRNERNASCPGGGTINSVTAVVSAGRSAKTMPLRRTAARYAAQAAIQSGLLPGEKELLAGLQAHVARWQAHASVSAAASESGGHSEMQTVETLIHALLKRMPASPKRVSLPRRHHLRLGPKRLADLTRELSAGVLEALGADFAADWQRLSKSHPNVGQVLVFLIEQWRHHEGGHPQGYTPHRPSLRQRAQQADGLADAVRQSLQSTAHAAQACAANSGTEADQALAVFTHELQAGLADLPAAHLHARNPPRLSDLAARIEPALLGALPAPLHAAWQAFKEGLTGIGELVQHLNVSLQPLAEASTTVAASLREALCQTAAIANASVRRADMDQLDHHAADLVAACGDLRSPRDLAAMMEATVRHLDLDEEFQMKDQRANGLSIRKLMKFVPYVHAVAEGAKGMSRSLDIRMGAHGLELFIGQSHHARTAGGLYAKLSIPGLDTVLAALPGVAAQLRIGSQHGALADRGEGVCLRLDAVPSDLQAQRLAFEAVTSDLAQASLLVGPGKHYPDVVSALLDRHPALSISTYDNQVEVQTGRTELSAEAGLNVTPLVGLAADLLLPEQPSAILNGPHSLQPKKNVPEVRGAPGLSASTVNYVGLGAYAATHSERGQGRRADTGGALQVHEYQLTARQSVDATGHLAHLRRGMGFYNAGGSHTLRVVHSGGSVRADMTQTVQRFNNAREFQQAIQANPAPWVALLVAKDTTLARSEAEKHAAAQKRLDNLLNDAGQSARPKITTHNRVEADFQIIKGLTPAAAQQWDALEASARHCESQDDPAGAQALRQSIGQLLGDDSSWTAQDLSFGKHAVSAHHQSPPLLPIFDRQAQGSGQALHVADRLTR